jgi:hypothetical protein
MLLGHGGVTALSRCKDLADNIGIKPAAQLFDSLLPTGGLSCEFRDMVGQTAIRPEG